MKSEQLPIYTEAAAIVAAVQKYPVVIVEGAAGTGKTTQLPQILQQAGLVPNCMGVTQPRRIAAISVASRIAQQVGCAVGQEVGYAIRFDDATSPQTRIKLMTDGILLQEARGDPDFSAYNIIMVDEAHERSLNIDFVLGLLHRALLQRPSLRVVISSATLHPGHFQRFFAPICRTIPVISLKTRTYPLQILHRPLAKMDPERLIGAIVEHVSLLHRTGGPGHVLIFLPGEGLIVRTIEALKAEGMGAQWRLLPLYGRLTRAEQERVFDEELHARKIVVATNLAETSITIDGVNFVIDCGLQKLPWFSAKTGVTTLREEPISQAAATQRAGRAGRVGPGTVIRLYSEDSFDERPAYSPEEILRVDLSEAVLRLIDLGVTDVLSFVFPTPPPRQKIAAALQTLRALGAIDARNHLTQIGRQMVPFPLSPQLSRMVVEAATLSPEVVSDVLLVGAFLSVRSPYTYPAGQEEAAKQAQRRLADPLGDAITAVRTYRRYLDAADRAQFCSRNFVDADTMAFITRAHRQLCDIAESHGVPVGPPVNAMLDVVRCVATGFAERLLCRRGYGYETLSGLTVALHPSSSLYQKSPKFIVAAELMNAGRLYAFNASAVQPEWLKALNPQAAAAWLKGEGGAKERRSERPQQPQLPTHLSLGGLQLTLIPKRRRPLVEITLEQVLLLAQQPPLSAEPSQRHWRAQVVAPGVTLMRQSLAYVLAAIPVTVWPGMPGSVPTVRLPPLGALLEAERNLHLIERYLPSLSLPVLPEAAKGKKKQRHFGWLALVANGGDGYWFDLMEDYDGALYTSLEALEQLQGASVSAALGVKLRAAHQHLATCAQRYTQAVSDRPAARH